MKEGWMAIALWYLAAWNANIAIICLVLPTP